MSHKHRVKAVDLIQALPPEAMKVLRVVAGMAVQEGARVALVGGVVRDLALGLTLDRDLDLVVEGNVPMFARQLATVFGGRVLAHHDPFGTATVALPAAQIMGGIRFIDLAQARTETYAHAGALPTVTPARLDDDLFRRDFTINAIALELNGPALFAGQSWEAGVAILDPFGGLQDLQMSVLRVLHPSSLRDDPTRILRGLRLAARLGLRFDDATQALLDEAVMAGGFTQISSDRVRNELCLVLQEPRPDAVLRLADLLDITRHLLPLQFTPALAARMDVVRHEESLSAGSVSPLLLLGLMTYDLFPGQREHLVTQYRLPKEAARLLREVASIQQLRGVLGTPTLPASSLDQMLQPFSDTALRVLRIAEPGVIAEAVWRYSTVFRSAATLLDGRDLLRLGVKPGPQVGLLLDDLRAAQLDGRIQTREQAEAWVRQEAGRRGDRVTR